MINLQKLFSEPVASKTFCADVMPTQDFAHVLGMVQPADSFLGFLVAELLLYCLEVQLIKVVYKKIFGTWL